MTEEQFAEAVAKLVQKALKAGLANDVLGLQLAAVMDGLDEDGYDWSEHQAA